MDTIARLRQIIADITHSPVAAITEDSSSKNVDGWDSIAQINIVVTVEMEFGVSFSADEMHALTSVQRLVDALKQQVPV